MEKEKIYLSLEAGNGQLVVTGDYNLFEKLIDTFSSSLQRAGLIEPRSTETARQGATDER